MHIHPDGNIELTAEENQVLMDKLEIDARDYDDPPVEIESVDMEDGLAKLKAVNTRTGKSIVMEFEFESD